LFTMCLIGLASCQTSKAPLDDAYYYPDKREAVNTASQESSVETKPTVEVVSDQDTTITVRIKR